MGETDALRAGRLPDGLTLGAAELAVSDLSRSVAFYEEAVGLRLLDREVATAELGGAGGAPIVRLVEAPGVRPLPRSAAGLFHVAILLPTRRDLAVAFARLRGRGLLTGASDHLVSEAIYLDDPDRSGIEIYRDRPAEDWPRSGGRIEMATDPLAVDDLLGELEPGSDLDAPAPADARLGHVHLKVGDLDSARAFWIDAVGLDLVTDYPGALFMSAGGYHHHVAANVWSSRGSGPAPDGAAGLRLFEIVLPQADDVEVLGARLARNGHRVEAERGGLRMADPWGATAFFRAA